MEPHGLARGTIIMPRWGEHPVPEDQFTHGQGRGPLGTGIESSEYAFTCNCPTRYEIYMHYNL